MSDLLARHRRAVDQAPRGLAGRIGGLALAAGVIWPFVGHVVPATAGKPLLAYAPAGPLLVVAVACLTLVRLRWKRALMHKELAGYREVLGLARALMLFAGGIGPAVAVSSGEALGLAALALVPLAVVVWITGHRQGSRKAGLRPEAEAYARAVVAARAAGAETPKLSPQLRALLDD